MKIYSAPEIEFIRFKDEEVFTASISIPGVDTPEEEFSKDKDYINPLPPDFGGFSDSL